MCGISSKRIPSARPGIATFAKLFTVDKGWVRPAMNLTEDEVDALVNAMGNAGAPAHHQWNVMLSMSLSVVMHLILWSNHEQGCEELKSRVGRGQ